MQGKRKMNILLPFTSRDILKCDKLFILSNRNEGQKRFSHGIQVKISTLSKKVEIIKCEWRRE